MHKKKADLPRIGIDLMGGENSPNVLLRSIIDFALERSGVAHFILIGTEPLQKELSDLETRFPTLQKNFELIISGEPIRMDENPLLAIRKKKNASLCIGMRLLKEGKVDALVSSGNTGALMSAAKLYLSTIKGILRPALTVLMPTKQKPVAVLDVGANIVSKTEHLIQFALMGSSYQKARGIKHPKVGLLNIGSEALKGTPHIKKAYQELEKRADNLGFSFLGNIEGKEVFEGNVDVLVTDGFTGNVFLKTAEGIANLVLDRLETSLSETDYKTHVGDLQKHLHYAEYPGALLNGVQGIVIKCHGYSTPQGIVSGIRGAIQIVEADLLKNIRNALTLS